MVRCESMSVHIPLHAYSSLQINLSSNLWQVTVCLLTFITYQWRSSGSNSTTYLTKDANWSKGEYWLERVGSMCGSMDRASVYGTEDLWFDSGRAAICKCIKIEASIVCATWCSWKHSVPQMGGKMEVSCTGEAHPLHAKELTHHILS